jgi:hypothetical protein
LKIQVYHHTFIAKQIMIRLQRKAERQVAILFTLSALGTILMIYS